MSDDLPEPSTPPANHARLAAALDRLERAAARAAEQAERARALEAAAADALAELDKALTGG